jgi:hypothetical protein
MTATVDFGRSPADLSSFDHEDGLQRLQPERDALADAAMYQQIADRRAQLENAEILRRARAL